MIRAGRVKLAGVIRRNPETPVHLGHDQIEVDGRGLRSQKAVYLVMNKPRGIVTTASDEKGRETVYSVLAKSGESLPWVAPVGRLDKASEGLLLLTNDSEWGARVAAPETHLPKTYHVQVGTVADDRLVQTIMRGIKVENGETLRASGCCLLRSGAKNCWLEVTLDEGKNRQIRRMLEALNVEVLRLVRVTTGPLELGLLAKGTYRHLTGEEKQRLDAAMTERVRREKIAHV